MRATRVTGGRIKTGRAMMQRHAALLSRIERQFGVPPQIVVAIWGLETDFGHGDMGKLPVIRMLATMAHDCRRTDLFQRELLAALKIVQRGDLPLRDMIGAYAGEIGQTQFLPSSYIKYGVDYDGNGHVDLRHSVPDVLASTANLLKTNGWSRRRRLPRGRGELRRDAGMESLRGLPQDHRAVRRSADGALKSVRSPGGFDDAYQAEWVAAIRDRFIGHMVCGICNVGVERRRRRVATKLQGGHQHLPHQFIAIFGRRDNKCG